VRQKQALQYAYCNNNPVNLIDPSGKKIVFVNGLLGGGSPKDGSAYWGGVNSDFVQGAEKFFNDKSTYFTDYNFNYLTSSTGIRNMDGYNYAKENYVSLTSGMDPKKDVFHIVSHSMGGAFSEGMIRYLKEKGWTVDVAIHFNTWAPSELQGSKGTLLVDATITNDWVQGLSLPIDGDRDIPNANYRIRKKSEKGWLYKHRDLIDNGDIWNTNNATNSGMTWTQAMSVIQSWLQQNPNIQISYGQ